MPRLVILNGGPDTAGVGIALKRAFDKYAPDWETRSICRQETTLQYDTDIVWPYTNPTSIRQQVTQLLRGADVVHVMDSERVLRFFGALLRRKTIIVHHLGSMYRRGPVRSSMACRRYGATEVTDSIDLLYPHVGWLPVPADLDALAAIRVEHFTPSKRIRIAHAPTHRPIKSTDKIIAAVEALSKRYPIDFDLIEGVSNRECLERKATCDIFVDQLLLGFGLNDIECWAMGIPVVSGLVDKDARRAGLNLWGGQFPWADATERTLEAVIEHLITNSEWRAELGERGRLHAQQWHSQQSVVEQTLAVYERARQRTTDDLRPPDVLDRTRPRLRTGVHRQGLVGHREPTPVRHP